MDMRMTFLSTNTWLLPPPVPLSLSVCLDIIDILSTSIEFKENIVIRPSDDANLVPIVAAIKEEMDNRYGQKFEKSKRVSSDDM
jgi:hypothetical protein